MLIEYQVTTSGQCENFEDVPKGAEILFIDGMEFIASCEGCGKPILEDDTYHRDPEGVYLCASCECSLINENQT